MKEKVHHTGQVDVIGNKLREELISIFTRPLQRPELGHVIKREVVQCNQGEEFVVGSLSYYCN